MSSPRPESKPTRLIYELAQLALIGVSGEDAQSFLHGQLTCDVNALGPGQSTYGAYCTPKGRVLASFLLWRSGEDFIMQLPAPLLQPIQKQLVKFILRSKVKAVDISNEWVEIGIAGPGAAAIVQRCLGHAPRATHDVVHADRTTIIGLPIGRFEVITPKDKAPILMESLAGEAQLAEPEYWDWLDIRAGIPTITAATQEEFVPQMANLDLIGGVSLTKGCYPGQEIVARMHYRGTLKQRMYLANIAGEERPQSGDKVYSPATGEQSCGMIVNAARSPEGGYDVLAVIQIASAEGGNVHWRALDGPALKLLTLPYTVRATP